MATGNEPTRGTIAVVPTAIAAGIDRVSADYRDHGTERAVIGFHSGTGRWTVEEWHTARQYRPEPSADPDYRVTFHADDRAALAYVRAERYR